MGFTPPRSLASENGGPVLLRDCDAKYLGVCEQAADERHILHASEAYVGDELDPALQEAIVFRRTEAPAPDLSYLIPFGRLLCRRLAGASHAQQRGADAAVLRPPELSP